MMQQNLTSNSGLSLIYVIVVVAVIIVTGIMFYLAKNKKAT
jgi:hypothetical protein